MNRSWKNFIAGLFVVPILNTVFLFLFSMIYWFLPVINETTYTVVLFGIGFFQFLYLVPIIVNFQRRGRIELVKGMLVSAFITVMLTCTCATALINTPFDLSVLGPVALSGVIVLALLIFYVSSRRSRPK
jgi:hypothetical protein